MNERTAHGFRKGAALERHRSSSSALALIALSLAVAACSGPSHEPAGGNGSDVSDGHAELQRAVDTLLRTEVELESQLWQRRAVLGGRDAKLQELVGELSALAQELGDTPADRVGETLERLSRLAGQIPVQASRIKRALRADAGLDTAEKAALGRRIDQVKVAARSLGVSVDELQAALGLASTTRLGRTEIASIEVFNGTFSPESQWHVLTEGHIDAVDVAYEDDDLGITIHDETVAPDVERDPARTVMVVKPAAKVQVPDERFAFLGPVGADIWLLPQSQIEAESAGILWPGIATAEVESGVFLNDALEVRIQNVVGPNGFSLFESPQDELSPVTIVADSEDGLPDTITMPVLTHRHVNWAFEAPGLYLVRVQARGRLDIGGNPLVTSPSEWLKFVVLP